MISVLEEKLNKKLKYINPFLYLIEKCVHGSECYFFFSKCELPLKLIQISCNKCLKLIDIKLKLKPTKFHTKLCDNNICMCKMKLDNVNDFLVNIFYKSIPYDVIPIISKYYIKCNTCKICKTCPIKLKSCTICKIDVCKYCIKSTCSLCNDTNICLHCKNVVNKYFVKVSNIIHNSYCKTCIFDKICMKCCPNLKFCEYCNKFMCHQTVIEVDEHKYNCEVINKYRYSSYSYIENDDEINWLQQYTNYEKSYISNIMWYKLQGKHFDSHILAEVTKYEILEEWLSANPNYNHQSIPESIHDILNQINSRNLLI